MEKTKVVLYGELADTYGKEFEFYGVDTILDCVDALASNFIHFRNDVVKKRYHVYVDENNIGEDELPLVISTKTIKIVPVLAGASGSFGKIILGAALIGLAFLPGGVAITAAGLQLGTGLGAAAFKIGVGLLLSGFADLIFSPPDDSPDDEKSYLFNGAVNITKEGLPVPIGYGRVKIGSTNISNFLSSNIPVNQPVSYYTFDPLTYEAVLGWTTSNKLVSTEYAKILDCLSEGEIQGIVGGESGYYLDGVSVLNEAGTKYNIEGVTCDERAGTNLQTFIPSFESASKSLDADNSEVPYGTKITYNVPKTLPEKIQVTLAFDGLYVTDIKEGKTESGRVKFGIGYSTDSNPTTTYVQQSNLVFFDDGEYKDSPTVRVNTWVTATKDTTDNVTNYGITLRLKWNKASSTYSFYNGDYLETITNYIGSWVKVDVQYREIGTSTWITQEDDFYMSNSNNETASVYAYINIKLNDYKRYEYRAMIDSAQVDSKGSTYTTLSIKPTREYLVTVPNAIYLEGKALAPFKKDWIFPIPNDEGNVTIEVHRWWEDDIDYNNNNDGKRNKVSKFKLDKVTSIVDRRFNYPNTALASMIFDAETYDRIPVRSYDVELLKIQIPDNYNPRTRVYTGLWNGGFKTAWSDNPAWAFYDLVTKNRYGLGQYIKTENINKWTLYEIAKFCDEEVSNHFDGREPRYTINTYITKQEEALVLLRHMASIFRGMVYWMDNKITATYDHDSDAVCMFSNANVIDGTFTYTGSAKDTRYNSVYVSWSDPNLDYKNAIELVEDTDDISKKGEILATDLTALGCASRGQAFRAGRALLKTERETVVFSSSIDNVGAKPGNLVEIYDRYRANVKYSGRVLGITGDVVQLDGPPLNRLLSDREYKIRLISSTPQQETLEDGTVVTSMLPTIHEYTFNSNPTTPDYDPIAHTINVTGTNANGDSLSATTDIPPNTVWAINEVDLQPQYFRVISIEEKESDIFEINALSFNKSKQAWIDEDVPMVYPKYRISRFGGSEDMVVTVQEEVRSFGGSIANVISYHWGIEPNNEIKEYIIEHRYTAIENGEDDWVYYRKVNDNSFVELEPNTPLGWYTARVAPVLWSGAVLPFVESTTTKMVGSSRIPADITGFIATSLVDGTIRLSWDRSNELDFDHYIIKNGPATGMVWENNAINYQYVDIINTHFDILSLPVGEQFMIKAVDKTGIESKNPATLSSPIIIIPPSLSNINGNFIPYGYELSWDTVKGFYPTQYTEIREGAIYDDTTEPIVRSYNNLFDTSKLDAWGDTVIVPPNTTHTYWLTPTDNQGNKGTEISYNTNILKPKLTNVLIDDEYLRIYFYFDRDDRGQFPVAYTELKVNGMFIANIYGEYYSHKATVNGSTTFELTPFSIAGPKDGPGREGDTYTETIVLDDGGVTYPIDTALRLDGAIPTSLVLDSGINTLTGPIADDTELWGDHFTSRGYTTIQNQIDAGYPNYMIPATIGTYSEVYTTTGVISSQTKISIRPIGSTVGILEFRVYQSNGGVSYTEITSTLTNGKYITSGSFDRIKVDYIFKPDTSGNVYTLESALIIGETS